MKLHSILSILFTAAALHASPIVIASSTFDSSTAGTEGWRVTNDGRPPVWTATGGNPGGYISATEPASGTTAYFAAPSKFLGDMSAAYGGIVFGIC